MTLQHHFQALAKYNTLANQRLYEACSRLSPDDLKNSSPASFSSIFGTLNHILVGDRIWLARFEGKEVASKGLGDILYDTFQELREARVKEDKRTETFTAEMTERFLEGSITYVNNQGKTYKDAVPLLLAHFFNHQTHHRGQIHTLLKEKGTDSLVLDVHRVLHPEPDILLTELPPQPRRKEGATYG
jgi:uncharacterized damage-inducible protein DinB